MWSSEERQNAFVQRLAGPSTRAVVKRRTSLLPVCGSNEANQRDKYKRYRHGFAATSRSFYYAVAWPQTTTEAK